MTKFYGISCHHLCYCLCHHLCCQLLCQHVQLIIKSVFVPIRSLQDIYYTIIPSMYVHSGDAVDCYI